VKAPLPTKLPGVPVNGTARTPVHESSLSSIGRMAPAT
jgi:hypothetical protein